MTSSAAG